MLGELGHVDVYLFGVNGLFLLIGIFINGYLHNRHLG